VDIAINLLRIESARTANFVDPAGHGWEIGPRGVAT